MGKLMLSLEYILCSLKQIQIILPVCYWMFAKILTIFNMPVRYTNKKKLTLEEKNCEHTLSLQIEYIICLLYLNVNIIV